MKISPYKNIISSVLYRYSVLSPFSCSIVFEQFLFYFYNKTEDTRRYLTQRLENWKTRIKTGQTGFCMFSSPLLTVNHHHWAGDKIVTLHRIKGGNYMQRLHIKFHEILFLFFSLQIDTILPGKRYKPEVFCAVCYKMELN